MSDLQQTPTILEESQLIKEEEDCEFEVSDDDFELDALNDVQKRMIKEKTVLSKKAPELNDKNMREAYIRQ